LLWTETLRPAQLMGVKRRISFDPVSWFDATTLGPACLLATKLAPPARRSAKLSYFATMPEISQRHKPA
jgi:hypothetical protein